MKRLLSSISLEHYAFPLDVCAYTILVKDEKGENL